MIKKTIFFVLIFSCYMQPSENYSALWVKTVWWYCSIFDEPDWNKEKIERLYSLLWDAEKAMCEEQKVRWKNNEQDRTSHKGSLKIRKRKRSSDDASSNDNNPSVDMYPIEVTSKEGTKYCTQKTWTSHRHFVSACARPEEFADMPAIAELIAFLQSNLVNSVAIFYENPWQVYEDGSLVSIPGFQFVRNSDGSIQSKHVQNLFSIMKKQDREFQAMAALVAHECRPNIVFAASIKSFLGEES